jgi:hypothetical protein
MEGLIYVCEVCGTLLEEHNCSAACPNCGRTLDCSDLPMLPATGGVRQRADGEAVFVPRPQAPAPEAPSVPANPAKRTAPAPGTETTPVDPT